MGATVRRWALTVGLAWITCSFVVMCSGSPTDRIDARNPNATAATISEKPVEYCVTPGCLHAAERISQAMDVSADPCQDFYAYACGSYVRNAELRDHEEAVNTMIEQNKKVQRQVKELLEEPISNDDLRAFKLAKDLYQSCMNTSRLEELGLEPAKEIIRALGGWPVLEGQRWNGSDFEWENTLDRLHSMGLIGKYLFDVDVTPILGDEGSMYVVSIAMPELTLDMKGYDQIAVKRRFQRYVNLATSIAVLLGPPDINKTRVHEEMTQLASFEMELNRHMKSLEARHDIDVVSVELDGLQYAAPCLDWVKYVKKVLPPGPGAHISSDERVSLDGKRYFLELCNVLTNATKRTVANYLVWSALHKHVLPNLNRAARTLVIEHKTNRTAEGRERWPDCIALVQDRMRQATSAMYVRRFAFQKVIQATKAMVTEVVREMDAVLNETTWMAEQAKSSGRLKTQHMKLIIGYVDELTNDTLVESLYADLIIFDDQLFLNILKLNKMKRQRSVQRFGTPVTDDWTSFYGSADEVNAYYVPSSNLLGLPIGILQEPLFGVDRPFYLNYGTIGYAIGHEVSHGFDEHGRIFGHNGSLEMWWDDQTSVAFDEKVQCIVQQYSNITDKEANVTLNGFITLSENIADNAGVKLAYRAYNRIVSGRAPEPSLELHLPAGAKAPTLTPQQLFWMSLANLQCGKMAPAEREKQLRTKDHLPGVHRLNGALRNLKAFAADFNCPAGSPMSPTDKCQVW